MPQSIPEVAAPDQYYSSQNQPMDLKHTSKDPKNCMCKSCGKKIFVTFGYYRCDIDNENYHADCAVKELRKVEKSDSEANKDYSYYK